MKTSRFLLAACILLALAFTFSCTDDGGGFLAKLPSEPEYCLDFVDGTKREHFGKEKEQFCDKRDGKVYVKVTIGEQTWMAENLKYNMYNSFCVTYNKQYDEEGEEICEPSWDRLYDWRSAMGACPIGWRLSNDDDWRILANYVGGYPESGTKLKADSGWGSLITEDGIGPSGNGTDDFGFSALPGGYVDAANGRYFNSSTVADFWSATEASEYAASFWGIGYMTHLSQMDRSHSKNNKFSVRCLLGDDGGASEPYREVLDIVASRSTPMTDRRDGRYKEYKTVDITTKTGTLTWMAQNLNYAAEGSKCIGPDSLGLAVDENTPHCDTYGRLYNWNTAINACPAGWRLPSRDEWASLGFDINKLKATSGWDYGKRNGTDDYGLALLPGGYAVKSSIEGHYSFYGNKTNGRWWGSGESETNNSDAFYFAIDHVNEYPWLRSYGDKSNSYSSVRCVRNK